MTKFLSVCLSVMIVSSVALRAAPDPENFTLVERVGEPIWFFVLEKVETIDVVLTWRLKIEKMPQTLPADFSHPITPDPEFIYCRLKHKEPDRLTNPLNQSKILRSRRGSQRNRRHDHHAQTHWQKFGHDLLLWRG